MKAENKEWTRNTNITEKELTCSTCKAEIEIYHSSPANGIFYADCPGCGKEINLPYKN